MSQIQILNADAALHPITWVEIDLKALAYNYEQLNKLAQKHMAHGLGVMPVIKSDAYGHGMLQIAQHLQDLGCKYLGVSNAWEGVTVRQAGFKGKILLFESTLRQDVSDILQYQLTPTVCDLSMAHMLDEQAQQLKQQVPIHIKIDTGMGRLGVAERDALTYVKQLREQCPQLILEGIYTHFPVADTDRDFTLAQMRRFRDIVYALENNFITFSYVHAGNSMGLGDYKSDLFNIARPGIMLYGIYPIPSLRTKISLKPVMSVKTKIIFVQVIPKGQGISYGHTFKAKEEMTVAILPIGYSNGYLRALSNKAFVIIHGVRCPVVGRVTMDQIIVDVTALAMSGNMPKVGQEAIIMGSSKNEHISADDLAHWADTISYEILCSLGSRLPRVFH
jgi:alanine racemase